MAKKMLKKAQKGTTVKSTTIRYVFDPKSSTGLRMLGQAKKAGSFAKKLSKGGSIKKK